VVDTPRPLYPRDRPGTHCIRRLEGPQGRSGQVRKISRPPEFDPRTVQPVVSRYTDRAIPAHCSPVHRYQIFPETCSPHPQFKKAETKAAGTFATTEQIYQTSRRLFPDDGNVYSLSVTNYIRVRHIALIALATEHKNGAGLL
jgi:hypothetical protein